MESGNVFPYYMLNHRMRYLLFHSFHFLVFWLLHASSFLKICMVLSEQYPTHHIGCA